MTNTLQVQEQKTVLFHNDELLAVRATDGQVYVSLRNLCVAVGIKRPQRQTDRIKRDEVLSDGLERVPMMGTGGRRIAYALRADLVPLWLAGIETSRVDASVRERLILYKREVSKVLWEAFQSGRLTSPVTIDELLARDTPAVQAYKVAKAVADLALNQVVMESRLEEHEARLEAIEATLGNPMHLISAEQAMHISQAVKTIALELGKRSGRNEFQGVYGELYRRFKVPSYRELPATDYDEAMNFLRDWYSAVVGGDVPF